MGLLGTIILGNPPDEVVEAHTFGGIQRYKFFERETSFYMTKSLPWGQYGDVFPWHVCWDLYIKQVVVIWTNIYISQAWLWRRSWYSIIMIVI